MKIQTPENYDSLRVMRGCPYDFYTKTSQVRRGTFVYSGVLIFIPYINVCSCSVFPLIQGPVRTIKEIDSTEKSIENFNPVLIC